MAPWDQEWSPWWSPCADRDCSRHVTVPLNQQPCPCDLVCMRVGVLCASRSEHEFHRARGVQI
eukprot:5768729-Prymnesium_polylepis.2